MLPHSHRRLRLNACIPCLVPWGLLNSYEEVIVHCLRIVFGLESVFFVGVVEGRFHLHYNWLPLGTIVISSQVRASSNMAKTALWSLAVNEFATMIIDIWISHFESSAGNTFDFGLQWGEVSFGFCFFSLFVLARMSWLLNRAKLVALVNFDDVLGVRVLDLILICDAPSTQKFVVLQLAFLKLLELEVLWVSKIIGGLLQGNGLSGKWERLMLGHWAVVRGNGSFWL